jgi:hypothetical protein
MSDKEIVERLDLITNLIPDRGFTGDEYAGMALAKSKVPLFTRGKKKYRLIGADSGVTGPGPVPGRQILKLIIFIIINYIVR